MASYSYNPNSSVQSDKFERLFDPFPDGVDQGFDGVMLGGSAISHSLLVLDSEKGELVKAPVRVGKKGLSEAKALVALKNHSEAERRRRERINTHLTTLRGLMPFNTERMNKAALLAEAISQVKELRKKAVERSEGFLIPMDTDEVKVEPCGDGAEDGIMYYRASLCCEYRPQFFSDLRQAIDPLQLEMEKSGVSTLGCRVKNEFVYICRKGDNINMIECEVIADNVHQALTSVLDKANSVIPNYSPSTTLPTKRRKASFVDTLRSSSS